MAQPNVTLEYNSSGEATPNWVTVGANDELVWTTGGSAGMGEDAIPYLTRPGSGYASVAPELWVGESGNYVEDTVYEGDSYEGGGNLNILAWTTDGAMNSAPIYTSYPTTAHANPTAGDNSLLGGTTEETSDTSHLKAYMVDTGASGTFSPTDGSAGAQTTLDTSQSLQGEVQYLQDPTTPSAAHSRKIVVHMYISGNENTGTHTPVFSIKYTWV